MGVGVGVKVAVAVGVGVNVAVLVGVGVGSGANNPPTQQPSVKKLVNSKLPIIANLVISFIFPPFSLFYFCSVMPVEITLSPDFAFCTCAKIEKPSIFVV